MKYIIVDLAYRGLCNCDYELDDEWYVDEDDDVCHECNGIGEFIDSLMYNIQEYFDYEGLDNIEEVQKEVLMDLLEWDYCEINNFGYQIIR